MAPVTGADRSSKSHLKVVVVVVLTWEKPWLRLNVDVVNWRNHGFMDEDGDSGWVLGILL